MKYLIINLLSIFIMSLSTCAQNNHLIEVKLDHNENKQLKEETIIYLQFINKGDLNCRILDYFEPLPVFFEFTLIDLKDNFYFPIPGAGKADIPNTLLSYKDIPPGGIYLKEFNLNQILNDFGLALKSGNYSLQIIYRNYYGDECIKGKFESNTINFKIN